jgi:transitional endoplasmic reticulum ATPase
VGRNIVTLDRKSKQLLGITSGDIVEIEGSKKTAAIVWPARTEDEGKDIIRMDNLIRHNAGVNLGEKVIVRPSQFKEAQKVVLAPTQDVHIIASGYERILKKTFIGRPLTRGDNVWITVFGSGFIYRVVETNPRGIVKVTDFTQFVLKDEPIKGELEGVPKKSYDDVGGLRAQVEKIREMIELPILHPELFSRLGIEPPKGILLHGAPGTGKTLLAKAVASETQAHFISVSAPSIMSKFVGEAEERVRQIFKDAEDNAPSIIFIDEIDAIAPKREEVVGEVERRVVAQLLSLMDGMESRGNVIVLAATNRVNSLDDALRRPGRFDREIEIGIPDTAGRLEILKIHTRGMALAVEGVNAVNLDDLASRTYGFVGADLSFLVKESAMKALRRYLPEINAHNNQIPEEVLEKMEVQRKDFDEALKEAQPSALREIAVEVPDIKWTQIGSQEDVKAELKQAVEWPLKYADHYSQIGIKPPTGILLYGPPGNGKTLLAKAVATESGANFISVRGPELINKWVGETEKGIRQVFKKARQVSPCIIFFDEFDAIGHERGSGMDSSGTSEKIVNQLLTELDGIQPLNNVVVIAATNRPDLIDPALKRPGRFDKEILVRSPDVTGREEILAIHMRGMQISKSVSIPEIAKRTEGFSGADLSNLVREAGMVVIQEKMILEDVISNLSKLIKCVNEELDVSIIAELITATRQMSENIQDDKIRDQILSIVGGEIKSSNLSKISDLIAQIRVKMTQIKIQVSKEHFDKVLNKLGASIPAEAIESYAEYKKLKTNEGYKPNYVR